MATVGTGVQQVYGTSVTANDSTAQERLGAIRYEYDDTNGLKVYKYIKFGTAVTNGQVLSDSGTAGIAFGVSTVNSPGKIPARGIAVGTGTVNYYGWMLVDGYHSAVAKKTTLTTSALKVAYHLCGKIVNALNGATATAYNHVDNIVQLASKACACTSVACTVRLM